MFELRCKLKVLITGVTGFVGSHMCDYLLDNHPDVEINGLLRWRSPKENILHCLDKIHLHYGDLTDYPSINKCVSEVLPDYIIHLAAQSFVPYSFDAPIATLEANCIGTCNLFESIKQVRKQNDKFDPVVLCCDSSEVYGQVLPEEIPIKETNQFRPASPYAVSKVCEDMLGYQYWLSWGIKIIRTRMFTHSGKRRGEVFVESNFAKQIAEIEILHREPVVYVGNLESIRTFADVRDTVRAYWLLLQKCKPGEVYNIGGNRTMSVGKMLELLISMSTAKNIQVKVDKTRLRPSDVTLQIPCVDKFKNETGWEPQISLEDTLLDMLNYWRENISTLRSNINVKM